MAKQPLQGERELAEELELLGVIGQVQGWPAPGITMLDTIREENR